MDSKQSHSLNIIFSRTDTIFGSFVRVVTGSSINHCSIAFDDNYSEIYSYTRKHRHLFFTGCFCLEPITRFTDYITVSIPLSNEEYNILRKKIDYLRVGIRVYDYMGLALLPFGCPSPFSNLYTCSGFAAQCLADIHISLPKHPKLCRPMDVYAALSGFQTSVAGWGRKVPGFIKNAA